MTLFRTVLLTSGLALALCGSVQAQAAERAPGKMMTLQMPATPDPVPVKLDPKTTALVVLDYVEDICNSQPSCKGKMLPAVTPFMERARKAGVTVAYGTRAQNMTKWLPQTPEVAGRSYDVELKALTRDGQMTDAELESLIDRLGEKKPGLDEVRDFNPIRRAIKELDAKS